jgi:hypothetical protein
MGQVRVVKETKHFASSSVQGSRHLDPGPAVPLQRQDERCPLGGRGPLPLGRRPRGSLEAGNPLRKCEIFANTQF